MSLFGPAMILQKLSEEEIHLQTNMRPFSTGMRVFAKDDKYWVPAKILQLTNDLIQGEADFPGFTITYLNSESGVASVHGDQLAFYEEASISFEVGNRVIAKHADEEFIAGTVLETPSQKNKSRYLVMFDNEEDKYCRHADLRKVCFSRKKEVYFDVPLSLQNFMKFYLGQYPERTIVRLGIDQVINVKYQEKWVTTKVVKLDESLALLHIYGTQREVWVFRGSPRLQKIHDYLNTLKDRPINTLLRARGFGTARPQVGGPNLSFAENITEECLDKEEFMTSIGLKKGSKVSLNQGIQDEIVDFPFGRTILKAKVMEHTLDGALKPRKLKRHNCSSTCVSWTNCSSDDVYKYGPLVTPLMFGFERNVKRRRANMSTCYKTPCGKLIKSEKTMLKYLENTKSCLTIDLFSFSSVVKVLRQFKEETSVLRFEDISNGREKVAISCVNEIDSSLPASMTYTSVDQPAMGVSINKDPNFLCSCDCTDNCKDATKCSCIQMTWEGQKWNYGDAKGFGYQFRRLLEKQPTAIFECNERCKCSSSCLNRVVQQPITAKLQLFKTEQKGYGVRCLHDLPKGAFICTYRGVILTDEKASEEGKKYGDEYLAELDYIEVVEEHKEGYEADVEEHKEGYEADTASITDEDYSEYCPRDDDDEYFLPASVKKNFEVQDYWSGQLRRRREHSVLETRAAKRCTLRSLYGVDEKVYVIDAKHKGNIAKYFNHSCDPNMIVQNVFVNTQDHRFPVVAFFASKNIPAGTELSWFYGYDVGLIPGKKIPCLCKSRNCSGRLL